MGQAFRRQVQGHSGSYPPEGVDLLQELAARLWAFLFCDSCGASHGHKGEGTGEKIKRPPGCHFRGRPKHDRAGQVVFIKTENLSFFRPWKTEG